MKIPTHRFKGSASLMGARQVVEVCARLEAAAGANDWPMIQSLMPCLDGLMQHIKTSTNALRGLLPDPCTQKAVSAKAVAGRGDMGNAPESACGVH